MRSPSIGGPFGIRFSSVPLDPSGVVEGQGGSSTDDFGGPQLAQASLVPRVVKSACSSSVVTSATSGFSDTTPVGDSPPQSGVLALDCLASVRETARQSGLSERAAVFAAGSRRDSTQVVYNSRLSSSNGVRRETSPLRLLRLVLLLIFSYTCLTRVELCLQSEVIGLPLGLSTLFFLMGRECLLLPMCVVFSGPFS